MKKIKRVYLLLIFLVLSRMFLNNIVYADETADDGYDLELLKSVFAGLNRRGSKSAL